MKRLFRHEFYKLFNSLTLKVMMLVAAGVALLGTLSLWVLTAEDLEMLASMGAGIGTGYYSVAVALNNSNLHIYFAVMITLIICGELKGRTMKNTALADFSRGEVYFAKFITVLVAVTILVAIHSAIYITSNIIVFGWGKAATAQSILTDGVAVFFMGLLLCYAVAAMLNFFAYLTQSSILVFVIAIVLPVLLAIVQILGIFVPFFEFIDRFSYISVLTNFALDQTLTRFAYYAVTTLLMLVGFTGGGYLLFRKQEIK